MAIENVFDVFNRRLSKLSRAWIVGLALVGVAIIGLLDYRIGLELSLSVFYLCPVGIASWYTGRKTGVLIALLATLSALVGDLLAGNLSAHPGILIWNGLLHLGFMLIVAYLLDRLHTNIKNEHKLARIDSVTGVSNRRAFRELLQYHLDYAAREGIPIGLAYIDLDDFKRVNDTHGHSEGDRMLQLFAQALQTSVRRTDIVARLGGDEFALLIPGANLSAAESLIAKVLRALQQAFKREVCMVTCSVGCVIFQTHMPSADDAIRSADLLMYNVKTQGKNAVAFEVFERHTG